MRLALLVGLLALGAVTLRADGRSSCFLSGERTSGQNKLCFYSCVTGEAAITIRATQLCPLRIER